MAAHGGYREGAGRPLGSVNKATKEHKTTLSELARSHSEEALETLVDVMRNGQSDSARMAAATAILDRGYGKPTKEIIASMSSVDRPTKIQLVPFNG